MTAPTINPNELTQDAIKETFVEWVEKGLDLAVGSMQFSADTLFAQAATSQGSD